VLTTDLGRNLEFDLQKRMENMSKWKESDYSNIIIGGPEDSDVVMTSVEAAEYLKMHVKTVCRLAKEKKIPAKKVGSEWRFLKSVLDKWLAQEVL
jgi:excisionase family DNA binding protein